MTETRAQDVGTVAGQAITLIDASKKRSRQHGRSYVDAAFRDIVIRPPHRDEPPVKNTSMLDTDQEDDDWWA